MVACIFNYRLRWRMYKMQIGKAEELNLSSFLWSKPKGINEFKGNHHNNRNISVKLNTVNYLLFYDDGQKNYF